MDRIERYLRADDAMLAVREAEWQAESQTVSHWPEMRHFQHMSKSRLEEIIVLAVESDDASAEDEVTDG